ncbi:hypothetical protein HDU96_006872 [Phlyctochytrium bullatum]|nr:hypothetical protein HDU96_006872 [Phlyctochytrium bullatum]
MASSDPASRTVLITGATAGLGEGKSKHRRPREIQPALSGPHTVILASRNASKVAATISTLVAAYPDAATRLHGLTIDIGSLSSVAKAVEELAEKKTMTEGIETTFATNHVGHYLLEKMLLPRMVKNAKARGLKPRVVIVSSVDPTPYIHLEAYTNSKLANALHGNDLAATHPSVSVATYCPGFITDNHLGFDNVLARLAFSTFVRSWLNIASWWHGTPTQVSWCEKSGRFLARLAVEDALVEESGVFWMVESKYRTSEVARDRENQRELRKFTEDLLWQRGYKWEEIA